MVALFLAEGFEEIEAITVIDILKRAKIDIKTVSIGEKNVLGGHGICVQADLLWDELNPDQIEMIVLPGGLSGVNHLKAFVPLAKLIRDKLEKDVYITAICAAPTALGQLGILKNKHATCYPGMEDELLGAILEDNAVVTDGKIITSKGPGTATPFALELVKILTNEKTAKKVYDGMICAAWDHAF